MIRAAQILVALLFFCTTNAHARAIDCAKAGGDLDAVVCADPEMRDYHRRISDAYANALSVWDGAIAPYVRKEQQQWLTAFRTIELETMIEDDCELLDLPCLRVELRRRVVDLESEAYVHSGVYRAANGMKLLLHPRYAGDYRVRVYDPARLPAVNVVTLEDKDSARWDGAQMLMSTMGDADGLSRPAGDGCILHMTPQPLAIQVSQSGACGGESYEGRYTRQLDETLRGYALELH